jgi:hypothetical protein
MKTAATFTISLSTLALVACGSKREPQESVANLGSKQNIVIAAAKANNVDDRALLAAAFLQSNFGTETSSAGKIPGSTRTSPFGLHGDSTGGSAPDDLTANAMAIAKNIRVLANDNAPTDAFDWLVLTAQAIVGGSAETPVAQVQTRLVLNELISTYNNGFTTSLPDGEIITIPPAQRPIAVEKLLGARKAALDPGAARSEFGMFVQANPEAEDTEKQLKTMPKVILHWCPASALVCFDHLRYSKNTSAHFAAYRAADGGLQFIQLHSMRKDLKWNDSTATNAVSIMLTGLAGETPAQYRSDWLNWRDYVSIQKMTRAVLRSFASFLPPGSLSGNPMDHVSEDTASTPITGGTLGGLQQNFSLPPFWDGKLLSEMLKIEDISISNEVEPTTPGIQTFPDVRGEYQFKFGKNVSTIAFDVDNGARTKTDSAWELIRRSNLRDTNRAYRFEEEFTNRGISGNEFRALRVTALNARGEPIGFRIVRFRLNGLINLQ